MDCMLGVIQSPNVFPKSFILRRILCSELNLFIPSYQSKECTRILYKYKSHWMLCSTQYGLPQCIKWFRISSYHWHQKERLGFFEILKKGQLLMHLRNQLWYSLESKWLPSQVVKYPAQKNTLLINPESSQIPACVWSGLQYNKPHNNR